MAWIMLHLYCICFSRRVNSIWQTEVSADNCVIHLCAASVINAILGYLAVYYVFHVGYSPEHESFMYFLQYAFLGEKKLPQVSVGVSKLVLQFDSALREVKESKGYKKLCI